MGRCTLEVVAPPTPEGGREPDVSRLAWSRGIAAHAPADPRTLRGWACPPGPDGDGLWDVGVVVSFRYFLPGAVLRRFRKGVVNVHPSLLPKYRGSSPVQAALRNADPVGGACVIRIQPGEYMDHGAVLARGELPIAWDAGFAEYYSAVSALGAELLVDCLDRFEERWEHAEPQPDRHPMASDPHFAHRIDRSTDCRVVFAESPAGAIYHRWRALQGDHGVWATLRRAQLPRSTSASGRPRLDVRTSLLDVVHPRAVPEQDAAELRAVTAAAGPGAVYFPQSIRKERKHGGAEGSRCGTFYVRCADSPDDLDPANPPLPWIGCREVHVACEKAKSAVALETGYRFRIGTVYEGVFQ
eukprot:TRINITY_DN32369_c0_g1_i3.p1 TRINITY_DN32369_c0_g1~~TRINITY_DN32369_c0_g1_i3.p1  ORF type:complete len:370 (+),score=70.82 TRINITY_DN32369_c0_g1_i3:43-1110(+)